MCAVSSQPIHSALEHRRVAFGDQRAVAAPGFRPRQACHAGHLAGNRHARAGQKAAGDFAQRGLSTDAPAQRVGKPSDAKRPDVGELRLIEDLARHHDHRRLEFVHGPGERRAVLHAGFIAQVRRAHLPFLAEHVQDRLRVSAQSPLLLRRGARPRRRESTESCAARGTSSCRARAWHSRPCRARRARPSTPRSARLRDPSARCAASPHRGARRPPRRATAPAAANRSGRRQSRPRSMKRSASRAVSTCRVASRHQRSSRYSSISSGICGLALNWTATARIVVSSFADLEQAQIDRSPIALYPASLGCRWSHESYAARNLLRIARIARRFVEVDRRRRRPCSSGSTR